MKSYKKTCSEEVNCSYSRSQADWRQRWNVCHFFFLLLLFPQSFWLWEKRGIKKTVPFHSPQILFWCTVAWWVNATPLNYLPLHRPRSLSFPPLCPRSQRSLTSVAAEVAALPLLLLLVGVLCCRPRSTSYITSLLLVSPPYTPTHVLARILFLALPITTNLDTSLLPHKAVWLPGRALRPLIFILDKTTPDS